MSKNTVRKKITGRQLMPGIFISLAISFLLFLYASYTFDLSPINAANEYTVASAINIGMNCFFLLLMSV